MLRTLTTFRIIKIFDNFINTADNTMFPCLFFQMHHQIHQRVNAHLKRAHRLRIVFHHLLNPSSDGIGAAGMHGRQHGMSSRHRIQQIINFFSTGFLKQNPVYVLTQRHRNDRRIIKSRTYPKRTARSFRMNFLNIEFQRVFDCDNSLVDRDIGSQKF